MKVCFYESTYESLTDQETSYELKDFGYVFKSPFNGEKPIMDNMHMGRRIYSHIRRCLEYLKLSDFMSAKTIFLSGILNYVSVNARKNRISPKTYIEIYLDDVMFQYNIQSSKSAFWEKLNAML